MAAAARTIVRLIGLPVKRQGTHDSLCAYYAAAMLLVSLKPELEDDFDAPHVARDPLFGRLPRRGRSVERIAADWLASGVRLGDLRAALDRAGAPATRFRLAQGARARSSLERVCDEIDRGLPSVLAWESRQMGNHTVMVVGYERWARTRATWLRVHDPSGVQELLEWSQLERLADRRLELLGCTRHDGWRPDKLTTQRARDGKLLSSLTRLERWDPRAGAYAPMIDQPVVSRGR